MLCKEFFGLLLGMCMCKLHKLGQGTYLMLIVRNAKGAWEDLWIRIGTIVYLSIDPFFLGEMFFSTFFFFCNGVVCFYCISFTTMACTFLLHFKPSIWSIVCKSHLCKNLCKVKKCNIILPLAIIAFFGFLEAYHKFNLNQWRFLKDPIFMVEKGYMFLSIHYEKSCFSKPHCLVTKAPKQLHYN
jgi:hypothetical protein